MMKSVKKMMLELGGVATSLYKGVLCSIHDCKDTLKKPNTHKGFSKISVGHTVF